MRQIGSISINDSIFLGKSLCAKSSNQPKNKRSLLRVALAHHTYLVTAKFDIWARREIHTISDDKAIKVFDQWLADYANAWLDTMQEHFSHKPEIKAPGGLTV
jgi:hypothetical protein